MDSDTPEYRLIFREELCERAGRLVSGARALGNKSLDKDTIQDLVRDAHTIKGSAALLGNDPIKEVGARLEKLWRRVGEGLAPSPDVVVAMEASAGRLVPALDDQVGAGELTELAARLDEGIGVSEDVPLRQPDASSLGGLLSSVSESLLGGATRVDTGDLYRLINRIVEVSLDAESLADLSLVTIEGVDQDGFRKSWRKQLERLSGSVRDLQTQAVSLANVPFFEAVSTYPQFVRYVARRLGKDVRFEISGEEIELDRQIIDLIRDPLRYLLVNAVDHGIETPDERVAAGKSPTGVVSIKAEVVEDRIEITVSDDGAGIDWVKVAETAQAKGMQVMAPDLSPVLFQPAFSTVEAATDFSGAGDGLPESLEAVEQVAGAVHIYSRRGEGTDVTLTLPLSLVLQNIVVVALGDEFWGLPEATVEATMPLSSAELTSNGGGRWLQFKSGEVPCVSLSLAVGSQTPNDEAELLVVSTRSGLVAVTVSEVVDRRRVAVKNLGPILEGAGHITGAALLGGGQVLVVLDPNFLGVVARYRPSIVEDRPRVLVVDDSAGVRQLLSATLNGAGFEVEVAGGAREAVLAMATDGFSAMVVDYSMPRSNGVELVRTMRAADINVPIVMVSGVATQEEKNAAWDVGVDAYLDKFDLRQGVLTKTLKQLIGIEEESETA